MEKPIIFSTEMVRAILRGQKTQTRRVVASKFNPANWDFDPKDKNYGPFMEDKYGEWHRVQDLCPYGQPGDILWVREALRLIDFEHIDGKWSALVQYKADMATGKRLFFGPDGVNEKIGWRPSIHMPREAARLFLLVKNVRVERLWDITQKDAVALGMLSDGIREYLLDRVPDKWCRYTLIAAECQGRKSPITTDFVGGFACIWDRINAKRGYGWQTNPWVWVIEFEVAHSKEDVHHV